MALFVSKENHCLSELLWKWKAGELVADIPLVISNHDDNRTEVESYGIPFFHIPSTKNNRKEAEEEALTLLSEHRIELVVLARYMQILTPNFVSAYPYKIINIHHSFLPAFIGANPYAKAFERGVKLIGATAHYVTDDLDEGPIIEQDIMRVNHRHTASDLRIAGRNIERIALARAVSWHLNDQLLVHGNKTIVFFRKSLSVCLSFLMLVDHFFRHPTVNYNRFTINECMLRICEKQTHSCNVF